MLGRRSFIKRIGSAIAFACAALTKFPDITEYVAVQEPRISQYQYATIEEFSQLVAEDYDLYYMKYFSSLSDEEYLAFCIADNQE